MNFLKYLILGIGIFLVVSMNAQENRALVTIAGEDITVDEFMYVYKKNNTQGDIIDKKSVQEYLDLYINFRLKVKEAEELGYDTVTAFKEELSGYREQLAEPYFVNEDIIEELLVEAYERKKENIRVSHILIMTGPNAMPEDTLDAYFKIMEARERIEAGESFAEVAKDVSEDQSARERISPRGGRNIPGNGGDLGYFTVFDMVYPFETGVFNTAVGEMSMPVRTDYGYHIIKVTDRIPALGTMEVAHLYLKMPDSATAQDSTDVRLKIDSLYQRIQEGESYEDLVKEYSDDKGSSGSGGLLPKFEVNRMVPEFIEVINTLQDSGDVSKPILTAYGWHIIKLYEKTGIMPFEEVEKDMRKRLEKDRRAQKSEDIIISDIKNEYGFTLNEKAIREISDIIDSAIFIGKWGIPEDVILNDVIFTLDDQTYSQKQFVDYIAVNQDIGSGENINEFVNRKFKQFADEECKAYEDSRLEEKHPDFKAIMKEYRDGILLFELTNNKIWSFATKDTTGLKEYYNKHKKEFLWDTRLDASIYTFNDTDYIEAIRELILNGKSEDEILTEINKDTLDIVRIEHKKFQKEDNELIDSIKWKKGIIDNMKHDGRTVFIVVHKKIAPEPKSFNEARGIITAGYQEYLEEKWIKELRAKYPVEIHEEVLSSLTN